MKIDKNFFKRNPLILGLIISFIALITGFIYSAIFNDNRLVEKTPSDYIFQIKDLSVIVPVIMFNFFMLVTIIYYSIKVIITEKSVFKTNSHTRTYPKYLYLTGFLGFLGFVPLIPSVSNFTIDSSFGLITFDQGFMMVALFGCFAFYYENKMANTLIDELYLANKAKAESITFKTALYTVFLISWLIIPRLTTRLSHQVLILTISLTFAFSHLFKSYLLYKYETEE